MNEATTPDRTLTWQRQHNGEHLAMAEGNTYKIVPYGSPKREGYELWFKYQDAPWSFVLYQDKVKWGKAYLQQLHDHPDDWVKHTGQTLPTLARFYSVSVSARLEVNFYEADILRAFVRSETCKTAMEKVFNDLLQEAKKSTPSS